MVISSLAQPLNKIRVHKDEINSLNWVIFTLNLFSARSNTSKIAD